MSARPGGSATRGGVCASALPRMVIRPTARGTKPPSGFESPGVRRRRHVGLGQGLLALTLLAAGPTLAACRSQQPASPETAPATLVIGVAQPRSAASPGAAQGRVASLFVSARLVIVGPDGRAQPALAARWETSADGRTWRFLLRPGLTFHDGSTLDAAAVRAALERTARSPETPGPAGLMDVERIEAPSALEVVITLTRPSSLLLEALHLSPITTGENADVGAGPFRITSAEGDVVQLSAFDGFYRGRPKADVLEIRGYPAPRAAWTAMMRGEVDFLYEVPPEAVEFVRAGARVSTFSFLRPYAYLLGVNLAHPLLARRDVRLALNAAIDRQAIVDRVLGGRGQPAYDHVFPRHWAFDVHLPSPAFDPRLAVRQLEQAGLTPSFRAPRRLAHRLAFTCLVPADYPLIERMALLVQKQLGDAGVDMSLEAIPLPEFLGRLARGQFDAYLFELASGQGFNYPYGFWRSSDNGGPPFRSGYSAADAALDRLRVANGEAEEVAAVRGLQEVMRADPPGVFLCWGETSRAVGPRFEVPAEGDRDIIATIERWRMRRGEEAR